jgi:single-strand DNA-binding protein
LSHRRASIGGTSPEDCATPLAPRPSGTKGIVMNVTVVTGHLTRPPDRRTLPSGEEVVSYDLSVVSGEDRAESVPVAWPAPPPSATQLDVGEALLVVGRVRRRFFRAGGSTQSRTEIVASAVLPLRRRAAVKRLLAEASAALDELVATPPAPPARRRGGPAARSGQVADAS